MGLFGSGKKLKDIEQQHNVQLKAMQRDLQRLERVLTNSISLYPNYNAQANTERYATTDDIYAIVSRLAGTAALIPLYAYQVKDERAAKQLTRLQQPHTMPVNTKALMLKALEDLPESDPVEMLLDSPNANQSRLEFFEAVFTLLYLEGEVFIYKFKPELGVNAGKPVELIILHPMNVVLRVTQTMPRAVVGYDYIVDGQTVYPQIPLEDVIHVKLFNPYAYRSEDTLRGLSPIAVLKNRLTQSDSITDVSTAQMQNGGVRDIVFEEGESVTTVDGQEVSVAGIRKNEFYKFISNTSNASAPFFDTSGGKMGNVKLGSTLADMQVLEAAKMNFKKLCNAFGTSDVLFNNGEASTESNVKEMTRRTITNTVLPNVYRVRDALNKWLLIDFKDKKREIREDISEIPELQANYKEMADTFAALPIMLPNEILRAFRLPFDEEDENLNKVYIKDGYTDIEQANMGVPDLPEL